MNKSYIVFDFETDEINPNKCSPIQFGATVIDPLKLKIIENSEFYSWCKPDDADTEDYFDNHKATLEFHMKNYGWSKEQLLDKIRSSPPEKTVFENFVDYIGKYHTKPSGKTIFTAPIIAGYNSFAFDFPILDRLCKKYNYVNKEGEQKLYFTRDAIDILKIVTLWLGPVTDISSYSMDSIRDYMGMATGQSHDAKFDVQQEAEILIKFLNLHKTLAQKIQFKNSFSKEA